MSHNVETMMYVREKPWHGLGVRVEEAPNSAEAIRLAGLDWEVQQEPVYRSNGMEIPNVKANVRSSDGSTLGVVSNRYEVVQNREAFEFTDSLIGGEVVYETAGSLREGKTIWLLARFPEQKILGDAVCPYLCFTNTHDGSGAIRVAATPVRVVCNNTLNLAMGKAERVWSTKHVGNFQQKVAEAQHCLDFVGTYMEDLNKAADKYANTSITDEEIRKIVAEIFPVSENDSPVTQKGVQRLRDEIMTCYFMPDILQFRNTGWGIINAAADMAAHSVPRRRTATYQERNFERIVNGHAILDKAVELVNARM